ncbi:tRNA-dihydrouridine synthase [Cellulomonas sp. SLBN-39]|uniref:tRNA-dihydrouridine synthase n=1 Tax=Cellulomonas sp. SLBN-39 TaxID=2768446 RepID=UPI00114F66C0|nr:tRNA-dihydrouridine synthase [Cellulomonas sp. SLBN-39]TQL02449.1 hypothetical protein FBY24_1525 [Cellulomonas sp. SLBN-39]
MPTRRSSTVVLGVSAALALVLSGCSSTSDYQGVCVEKASGTRLDDADCDDDDAGYTGGTHGWYYLPRGASAPPVGEAVSGGTTTVPSDRTAVRGGVSAGGETSVKGGSVSRGGFGGTSSHVGG